MIWVLGSGVISLLSSVKDKRKNIWNETKVPEKVPPPPPTLEMAERLFTLLKNVESIEIKVLADALKTTPSGIVLLFEYLLDQGYEVPFVIDGDFIRKRDLNAEEIEKTIDKIIKDFEKKKL